MKIILASSSSYRKELLKKLKIDFSTQSPEIDESKIDGETAQELVARLALGKAQKIAQTEDNALIIGSDQVAVIDENILGKSGNADNAFAQLKQSSAKVVNFYTGLCLLNSKTGDYQLEVVPFKVHFRKLSDAEIKGYIEREQPFNCAGSFQAEGLGVALFEKLEGDDPNTLIGLPLMRLSAMLTKQGINVLTFNQD